PVVGVWGVTAPDEAESVGDDHRSTSRTWIALIDHLRDVEESARHFSSLLDPPGLGEELLEAAFTAARFHDIGKAHTVFQTSCEKTVANPHEEQVAAATLKPWAKSGGSRRFRHDRRHFRHELASALALLSDAAVGLEDQPEPELAIYLVGAHHGRVRAGIRSLPGETPCNGEARSALGICDGDVLPAVDTPWGTLPSVTLNLGVTELGSNRDGGKSWTQMALELRDRPDLGPFRLGFLEALVRLSDWDASAREELPPQ
ncbi:MAG: CRISPR-associated endonuclease Cas3'', partial [Dehalococcoidia bacterium]